MSQYITVNGQDNGWLVKQKKIIIKGEGGYLKIQEQNISRKAQDNTTDDKKIFCYWTELFSVDKHSYIRINR